MRRIARFAALPASDRSALLQALAALAVCKVWLTFGDVHRLRGWATRPGAGGIASSLLVWAIERSACVVPGCTCLVRALALQHVLSRNGHASELRIGVSRAQGDFAAHAWLVQDGTVLIGDGPARCDYEVLASWCGPAGAEGIAGQGASR